MSVFRGGKDMKKYLVRYVKNTLCGTWTGSVIVKAKDEMDAVDVAYKKLGSDPDIDLNKGIEMEE